MMKNIFYRTFSYLALIPFLCTSIAPVHAKYITPRSKSTAVSSVEQSKYIDQAIGVYNGALKLYNEKGLLAALNKLSSILNSHDKDFIKKSFRGFPELPTVEKVSANTYKVVFSDTKKEQQFEILDFDNGVFKVNGQVFNYDMNASFEENTNRIVSMFENSFTSFNPLNWIVGSAHAAGNGNLWGILAGVFIGWVAIKAFKASSDIKDLKKENERLHRGVASAHRKADDIGHATHHNTESIRQNAADLHEHIMDHGAE